MSVGFVYLIRNKSNNKGYVGFTTDVAARWKQHQSDARRGDPRPLYCSIRKHGLDEFEVSVLEGNVPEELLGDAEIRWIAKLKTCGEGYNLTEGGNGYVGSPPIEMRKKIAVSLKGHVTTQETKDKISDSLTGRKLTEEVKAKIKTSLNKQECVERRRKSSTGKKHSYDVKKKISESNVASWTEERRSQASEKRKGSLNSRAHLDEARVRKIRESWRDYDSTARGSVTSFCNEQATENSVSQAVVFRVIMGYSWKHVILTNDSDKSTASYSG